MAGTTKLAVGARSEDIALQHLTGQGHVLLRRNFRCRLGEIDLIMRDADTLVFVEVRHRRRNRFASAAQSVNIHKQRKIVRAAAFFLGRHRNLAQVPVRFDVVALDRPGDGGLELTWVRDAFRPERAG